MPKGIGDYITIGNRKGYILDMDSNYIYVVYKYKLSGGVYKPYLNDKVYQLSLTLWEVWYVL